MSQANTLPMSALKERVGTALSPSDWMLIDQQRIDQFADVTLDHQFIHVDPSKAAQTPFGTTIAHGFLTLSLLSHLAAQSTIVPEGTVMGINYGFDKIRFLNPVKVGSRIRACMTLEAMVEKAPGQYQMTHGVTVEIDGEEKPALIAQWLSLVIVG